MMDLNEVTTEYQRLSSTINNINGLLCDACGHPFSLHVPDARHCVSTLDPALYQPGVVLPQTPELVGCHCPGFTSSVSLESRGPWMASIARAEVTDLRARCEQAESALGAARQLAQMRMAERYEERQKVHALSAALDDLCKAAERVESLAGAVETARTAQASATART